MAEVPLAVEQVVRAGLEASYTGSLSAANTYQCQNDGRTFLHFKKSAAVICTVTIPTTAEVDGKAVGDQTVAVPATTGDRFIGPFPPKIYNVKQQSYFEFTLSDVDGLTVAVMRL